MSESTDKDPKDDIEESIDTESPHEASPSNDLNEELSTTSEDTDETVEEAPVETSPTKETETPAPTPVEPTRSSKKPLIIALSVIGGIIVLGGIVTALWWFLLRTQPTTDSNYSDDTTQIDQNDALSRFVNPTTGETWYDEPVALPDQKFYAADNSVESKYYEVGKRGDNTIIMSETIQIGAYYELFEKAPDDTITAIPFPNANVDQNNESNKYLGLDEYYAEGVVVDRSQHYDSLSIPSSLPISDAESVTIPVYNTIGDLIDPASESETSAKKVEIKGYGDAKLVRIERTGVDSGLTTFYYAVELPLGTRVIMGYEPISTTLDGYTWTDGKTRTGDINGYVRGCGTTGMSVTWAPKLSDGDFVEVARNDKDQPIFGLKSVDSPIIALSYNDYLQAREYMQDGKPTLSKQEFFDEHAVLAFKNDEGQWLLYTQDDYSLVGGCGKPVIYLYPTKTETVNVRVGAEVTVSDPFYNPATGWQRVVAQPNGQLTYQGAQYESLFWEGTGHGAYPAITSGTVVPRAAVEATLRAQLAAQGLNQKESNDFMEFWVSQIPNKPYVQLAWFSRADLDELAPLYISPKPQTSIRVFLDMRGLDAPKTLPAPTFTAPARNGFTVVEWGGLLSGQP